MRHVCAQGHAPFTREEDVALRPDGGAHAGVEGSLREHVGRDVLCVSHHEEGVVSELQPAGCVGGDEALHGLPFGPGPAERGAGAGVEVQEVALPDHSLGNFRKRWVDGPASRVESEHVQGRRLDRGPTAGRRLQQHQSCEQPRGGGAHGC